MNILKVYHKNELVFSAELSPLVAAGAFNTLAKSCQAPGVIIELWAANIKIKSFEK